MPYFLCDTESGSCYGHHRVLARGIESEAEARMAAKTVHYVGLSGRAILPGIVHTEAHNDVKQLTVGIGYVLRHATSAGVAARPLRTAVVNGGLRASLSQVRAYLPSNYEAAQNPYDDHEIVITGRDDHGWTLDGYVIPRLASGLIAAREVK